MEKRMRGLSRRSEFYTFLLLAALAIAIEAISGQFFTANNFVDILSAMIVPGIFAVVEFMVIVSGGIDVSSPALASLSVYAVTRYLLDIQFEGGILLPLVMVALIGAVLGAFNGFFIGYMNLNPMIVTLGASSIFRGIMQGALNATQLTVLPEGMRQFGMTALFVTSNSETGLTSKMPLTFIVFVVVLALAAVLMRNTFWGRGIYAIGGNVQSALCAGYHVKRTKFFVYVISGAIASIGGLCRVCVMQQCHPTNMLGMEMNVIAGVVLGGTAITGGSGTLTGCMLGTALIVVVENSMIMLGIPTTWKNVFTGALIVLSVGFSALQLKKKANKVSRRAKEV